MRGLPRFLLFLFLFAADFLSKSSALRLLPSPPFQNGGGFFSFALYFNHGIAFSLLNSVHGISMILGIAGLLLLSTMYFRLPALKRSAAWALLFAGAAGNMADRVVYGYVIDWLRLGPLHLNAADLFLSAGALVFTLSLWRER